MAMESSLRWALLGIDGVDESPSSFSESQAFWVNGTEIAHLHRGNVLEIRLGREQLRLRRAELRAIPYVRMRMSSTADWLEVVLGEPDSVALAVSLVEAAADIHRAPDGTIPKPPPEGAALEQRRRFH